MCYDNPSGGRGGRGRGHGRGQNYSGTSGGTKKQGMCPALGTHMFDYGQKESADQMRTSWDKLCQYVGANYAHDIGNELQNKTALLLREPEYNASVTERHKARITMVKAAQDQVQQAREMKRA